jgi:hypothetical protein
MDVAMFSSSLEVLSFVLQKEGNGVEGQLLILAKQCIKLATTLYLLMS